MNARTLADDLVQVVALVFLLPQEGLIGQGGKARLSGHQQLSAQDHA